ncbi:MAG: sortase-associated OmpA-like protein PdsO [Paraglaciecola polaris]|uniref:sortase-associated OmpA-like protein PdsO n=1 Tax=Paraglaciecola polaris TaxID=222814 RepID=UPI0030013D8B
MKYAVIALTLSLIMNQTISSLASAETNVAQAVKKENKQNDMLGFGSGALFGSAVAGPVGSVLGAILGLFIANDVNNDKALAQAESQLADKDQQLLALQSAKQRTHQQGLKQTVSIATLSAENNDNAQHTNSLAPIESNIQFRTASHLIEPHYQRQLDLFAQALRESPQLHATLAGYADERGDTDYNQALSQQRAINVKNYLLKQDVNPAQLRTESFGETRVSGIENDREGLFFARKVTVSISAVLSLSQSPSMMTAVTH